jgi:hypothetical protein
MRKWTTIFLPGLLAIASVAAILPVKLAYAQSGVAADTKDQEIELLKSEVKLLEQRVNRLEGLNQKVSAIDHKVEIQKKPRRFRPIPSANRRFRRLSSRLATKASGFHHRMVITGSGSPAIFRATAASSLAATTKMSAALSI